MRQKPNGAPYRHSRQRDRILELLRGSTEHPTASWLYDRLREEFPDLSLGTVYRNLGVLLEQGLINRIAGGSTFDRFDANVGDHYHLVCESCGAVIDLALPVERSLNEKVQRISKHRIRRHDIQFRGVCEMCAAAGK